jgi:hypothetical protein
MAQITTTIRRWFSELNNAERHLRDLRGEASATQ